MKLKRRIKIILFVVSIFLLSLIMLFKSKITGYATFSTGLMTPPWVSALILA